MDTFQESYREKGINEWMYSGQVSTSQILYYILNIFSWYILQENKNKGVALLPAPTGPGSPLFAQENWTGGKGNKYKRVWGV